MNQSTSTFRVHFQLTESTGLAGTCRVEIRCQSPIGSSSRRSVTLGVEECGSLVLAEFTKRARALRTTRPFTVRESAELLSEVLKAVREDLATEGKV
jgi:hypothetical protein